MKNTSQDKSSSFQTYFGTLIPFICFLVISTEPGGGGRISYKPPKKYVSKLLKPRAFNQDFSSQRTGSLVRHISHLGVYVRRQSLESIYLSHGCHMSGNSQRKKNSSRSGKCQGILFWVRENWHFEEKWGKIENVSTKPRFLTNFWHFFDTLAKEPNIKVGVA